MRRDTRPQTSHGISHKRIYPPGDDGSDWVISTADADEVLETLVTRLALWLSLVPRLLNHDQLKTLTQDRKVLGHGASNVAAWLLAEEAGGATDDLRRALFGDVDPSRSTARGNVPMGPSDLGLGHVGRGLGHPPLTVAAKRSSSSHRAMTACWRS